MTQSYSGTGEVRGARSSGVLAHGLTSSSLLKETVLLDEYGRDYVMDLTAATSGHGMSLEGLVGDAMTQLTPLAVATDGVSISALLVEDTTPAIAEWMFTTEDTREVEVRDVFITAALSDDVAASFGSSLSLSGRVNDFDAAASPAFNNLFIGATALNSPYALVSDGGDYFGADMRAADELSVRVAHVRYSEQEAESDPIFFELPELPCQPPGRFPPGWASG
jgi:hypothetical protein